MKLQSEAANRIKALVSSRTPEKNMAVRVEVEGDLKVLEVYRVPISMLRFNIRNGRFASELQQKEKQLKRRLDNSNPRDSEIIRSLLLEQSKVETDLLKEDLIRHGQIEPGIITSDGAVINANRRMSVISLLFEETRDPKWEYLKVGVLPDNVSEKDLWRIEAGLQFGKDFRFDYGPINELLKLREGLKCGLQPEDIAQTLLGRFTEKDVDEKIRRLELIDSYLDQIGKSGDYTIISDERLMEKFNSLSTNVINHLAAKSGLSTAEQFRIAQVGFGLINHKLGSHWDIRKLASIARSVSAKKALLDELPEDPFEATKEALDDAFDNAKNTVDAEDERGKPERLLQKALTTIRSIDPKNSLLAQPGTQTILGQLLLACAKLRVR